MAELLIKGFRDKDQVRDFIAWWSDGGGEAAYSDALDYSILEDKENLPWQFGSKKETKNGYEMEIK